MMLTYLMAIGLILLFLLAYVAVQRLYTLFQHRHPELGPFRREGGGCCGGGCCGDGGCDTSAGH